MNRLRTKGTKFFFGLRARFGLFNEYVVNYNIHTNTFYFFIKKSRSSISYHTFKLDS